MGRFTPRSEAQQDWEAAHDMAVPETLPIRRDGPLPVVLVDFETRSYLNVKDTGAWRYAEDDTTEILCMAYKIGDGETKLWVPELSDFPAELIELIEAGATFEAHNVQFERAVWLFVLKRKMGIPVPRHWRDTLAVCAYRGIPLGLDQAGNALKLPVVKDKRGKYLLQQLSTPKWGTKKEPDRIYREDWDLMQELYDYCVQDVDAEDLLGQKLGVLPPAEQGMWIFDQRINQRGVQLDVEAVKAALFVITTVEESLNEELREITGGAVERATQRDRMLKWFRSNGLAAMPNLTKETIEDFLDRADKGEMAHLDPKVIRAVQIRAQLAKASTKKLEKMMQTVSSDGRIRGLLQYHGAGTGRWAGRLVQPHNFPRPFIKENMDTLVEMIKRREPDDLEMLYGSAMDAVSSSLRGMFIAAPEHELHICDFSAIEARVTFWVAGCDVGLEVFHKSDRGESEDIYCVTASDLVGYEVRKAEHGDARQLGKITVLGCGYQMGWEKLKYQAEKDYKTYLTDEQAQQMVSVYRSKYEEVKWLWYGLQDAAIRTVKTGKAHFYRKITFDLVEDAAGRWLTCILPNGRRLWYYNPFVLKVETPWGVRDQLHYEGRDNKRGGAWGTISTYGGMLTENVVQAISRDLMAEAMVRVENAGWPIILTVHDEIIAEVLKKAKDYKEFERLMAVVPDWADGCPIAVEGGVVTRYQKV